MPKVKREANTDEDRKRSSEDEITSPTSKRKKRSEPHSSEKTTLPTKHVGVAKSDGMALIDELFEGKKAVDKDRRDRESEKEQQEKEEETKKRKRNNNPSSHASAKSIPTRLRYNRDDLNGLEKPDMWKDDGLGGMFNKDGWTGRQEGGVKVYKAHLFNRKGFGSTPQCPFDCDCCYI